MDSSEYRREDIWRRIGMIGKQKGNKNGLAAGYAHICAEVICIDVYISEFNLEPEDSIPLDEWVKILQKDKSILPLKASAALMLIHMIGNKEQVMNKKAMKENEETALHALAVVLRWYFHDYKNDPSQASIRFDWEEQDDPVFVCRPDRQEKDAGRKRIPVAKIHEDRGILIFLARACEYKSNKPVVALFNAQKCMESICRTIYNLDHNTDMVNLPISSIISKLSHSGKMPSHISMSAECVIDYVCGSACNPATYEEAKMDDDTVNMVFRALSILVCWYFSSYRHIEKVKIIQIVCNIELDPLTEEEKCIEAERSSPECWVTIQNIREKAPYPLAKLFITAFNCSQLGDRHLCILKSFEVLIKYLAIPCIQEFDITKQKNDKFAENIQLIRIPSLGSWVRILRDTSKLVQDYTVGKIIYKDLYRDWMEKPVREAYQLFEQTGNKNAGLKGKVKLIELFEKIGNYRNTAPEAHGGMASESMLKKNTVILLEALKVIILNLDICKKMDLICFEKIECEESGYKAKARIFQGCQPLVDYWNYEEKPYMGVCLCRGQEQILRLTPWMIYGEGDGEKDFFIFNNENHCLTYYNSNIYRLAKELKDIEKILSRHKVVSLSKKNNDMIEGLMELAIEDGKITGRKMDALRKQLPKLGIVKTADEVESYIRNLVNEKYPNVCFEDL